MTQIGDSTQSWGAEDDALINRLAHKMIDVLDGEGGDVLIRHAFQATICTLITVIDAVPGSDPAKSVEVQRLCYSLLRRYAPNEVAPASTH